MPYHQLTLEERESSLSYIIRALVRQDRSALESFSVDHQSRTVSQQGFGGYRAVAAQERTARRRRERPLIRKMDDPFINESVRSGLSQEWSPEEIAGRMSEITAGHNRDECRIRRSTAGWRPANTAAISARSCVTVVIANVGALTTRPHQNRVSIEQRPAKVDSRRRFGDWEGDTVHGADHSGMIMTCVERKSGFLITAKMKNGTSARLNAAKDRAFRIIPPTLRQTLTVDNGKEFSGHEQLSKRLQIAIYFAHAYSSNERSNKRKHQRPAASVLPEETDFRDISHNALAHVTNRLNNRPRKRLNYLTPLEVLTKAGFALQM